MQHMEQWKAIPGYEGIYEASTFGNIRTVEGKTTSNARYAKRVWKSRVLKFKRPCKRRNDARVSLWKNGKVKDVLVSRLVASTWIGVPTDDMTVNHINGDWNDNRIENLEWVTLSENIKKGFEGGQYSSIQMPVTLHDGDGGSYSFPSKAAASRFLGRRVSYVCQAMKKGHRIKSATTEQSYTVTMG